MIDIHIANQTTIGEPGQIGVDAVDDGHDGDIVIARRNPRENDCRCGRLVPAQLHDRANAASNVFDSRIVVADRRTFSHVIGSGHQYDDLWLDTIELAIFQTPEYVLRTVGPPAEVGRVPAVEIFAPVRE